MTRFRVVHAAHGIMIKRYRPLPIVLHSSTSPREVAGEEAVKVKNATGVLLYSYTGKGQKRLLVVACELE